MGLCLQWARQLAQSRDASYHRLAATILESDRIGDKTPDFRKLDRYADSSCVNDSTYKDQIMWFRSIIWSALLIPFLAGFAFSFEDDAKQNLQTEQAKPPVSVRLTKVSAERHENETWFYCTVKLDNETGHNLIVHSHFSSAFDGFEIIVTSKEGKNIVQKGYTLHQSPFGQNREFVLKKGSTTQELLFPIPEFPADIKSVNVQLIGKLYGSAYERKLSTQTVAADIKKPSEKDKK